MNRVTLGAPAQLEGTGLFTGAPARVRLHPAPARTGILLRHDGAEAPADVHHLADIGAQNTSISTAPGAQVLTVEHLMSAIAALGVTDVVIDVDGPEIPIGDGSSAFMLETLATAGLVTLDETIEPIAPRVPLHVEDDAGATIDVIPADRPEYVYALSYPTKRHLIADQEASWHGDVSSYTRDVAPARTYCLEEEARAWRAAGHFSHLTPRDMLVIGEHGPIDNAFRFPDEPARHKLLDLIGDLALAGAPLRARVVASRAGHALNHRMALLLATTGRAAPA